MKTLRQNLIRNSRVIVIKVGTNVLTKDNGILDRARIADLVRQLTCLIKDYNKKIILVSSGAIGAGMGKLGIAKRPKNHPDIQALAAVGQSILIEAYRNEFNLENIEIGQILVTREDFQNRFRYQNMSNTLSALLKRKILPIFNENDTISTHEISFGDNDQLTILVSHAIHADLVVILTSTEGLLDMDDGAKLIEFVPEIDKKILSKITAAKSSRGSGGMLSKIQAIRKIVRSGQAVIMAKGMRPDVLVDIFKGEDNIGTFFKPAENRLPARKKWIAYSAKIHGEIIIDEGAKNAILSNRSLLPSGVKAVGGEFAAGSIVKIICDSEEIGRGVSSYDSQTIAKIKGMKTKDISSVVKEASSEEIIHKDNLVLTC